MQWFKAKLRAQFSSEVAWRIYVVLQGLFFVIMFGLSDSAVPYGGTWEFMFPRFEYDDFFDGDEFWVPLSFYVFVPFIIVKAIDWVAQAREGGPSEKIRNKPPIPKLESAESKHDFGKSEERVAERGLQRQRSEKWKGPLWFCLRILVWLVAFAIGATIVRMLARGYIGG